MSGVKDDGNPAVKEFTLTLVAIGGEGEALEFAWTLEENRPRRLDVARPLWPLDTNPTRKRGRRKR